MAPFGRSKNRLIDKNLERYSFFRYNSVAKYGVLSHDYLNLRTNLPKAITERKQRPFLLKIAQPLIMHFGGKRVTRTRSIGKLLRVKLPFILR